MNCCCYYSSASLTDALSVLLAMLSLSFLNLILSSLSYASFFSISASSRFRLLASASSAFSFFFFAFSSHWRMNVVHELFAPNRVDAADETHEAEPSASYAVSPTPPQTAPSVRGLAPPRRRMTAVG